MQYRDNYTKTSASWWQHYRDKPNTILADCKSFEFKVRIIETTPAAGNIKVVKKELPLKHLSIFCRTLKMLLSNCEINFILTWSADCVISSATGKTKLAITDTKLYVPVVILSSRENGNHLNNWNQVLKGINWSKY